MSLWDQQSGESVAEYLLLRRYLDLAPYVRSLDRLRMILAKADELPEFDLEQLATYRQWEVRAAAFDAAELQENLETRRVWREALRQELYREAVRAMVQIRAIMAGKMPSTAATERKSGRPVIKPGTILQACWGILDRCGVTVPKRIELTTTDDAGLELDVQARVRQTLTTEDIQEILGKLGQEAPSPVPALGIAAMGGDRGKS